MMQAILFKCISYMDIFKESEKVTLTELNNFSLYLQIGRPTIIS